MLTIKLDKDAYQPGDTITVTVQVDRDKPTKARGVFISLSCSKRKMEKESRVMDQYDFDREKELGGFKHTHLTSETVEKSSIVFSEEKAASGEQEYTDEIVEASFVLPNSAPPTSHEFGHDNAIYVWTVTAKLDIPLAIDDSTQKEIVVEGLGD